MMRYRPTQYEIKSYPLDSYPAKSKQAASIMLMIHNNLDNRISSISTRIDYLRWKWCCIPELGAIQARNEISL